MDNVKLYCVTSYVKAFEDDTIQKKNIVACNEKEAENKAIIFFTRWFQIEYDYAKADEVDEIDGYKIKLEKI